MIRTIIHKTYKLFLACRLDLECGLVKAIMGLEATWKEKRYEKLRN
jgi:hypothetical protein